MTVERDPALISRPLSEHASQPIIQPRQWIVHTAVDGPGPTNLGDYFEHSTSLESHTWLRWDRHEQLMDLDRQADANFKANRFLKDGQYWGAISTETEDDGTPEQKPWNPYQIGELIRFGVWLHRTFGIPARLPRTWDDWGMGYHSLFPMVWTNVKGKTCPGQTRIRQFTTVVLPGIQAAINTNEGDLQLMPGQYENLFNQATSANGKLDDLKRRVETIENEFFHFPEVDPAVMPVTGQRKQQLWGVLAVGKELPDLLRRFEEKLAQIDQRLGALEQPK